MPATASVAGWPSISASPTDTLLAAFCIKIGLTRAGLELQPPGGRTPQVASAAAAARDAERGRRARGPGQTRRAGPGSAGAAPERGRGYAGCGRPAEPPPGSHCRPRAAWERRPGDGQAHRPTDGPTDRRGAARQAAPGRGWGLTGAAAGGGRRETRNSRAELPAHSLPSGMFSFLIFCATVFFPPSPASRTFPTPLRQLG